jgi:hypothetical protein
MRKPPIKPPSDAKSEAGSGDPLDRPRRPDRARVEEIMAMSKTAAQKRLAKAVPRRQRKKRRAATRAISPSV